MGYKQLLICCFLVLFVVCAQAQGPRMSNRVLCKRIMENCKRCSDRMTNRSDKGLRALNKQCRVKDPRWVNISRCELLEATCLLSIVQCDKFNCANIDKTLRAL